MSVSTASILFEPTFTPADAASRDLVLSLAADLDLKLTPAKTKKVIVILSSLLWACDRIRGRDDTDNLIGWSHDDHYWDWFPAVGKRVVSEVREALIAKGFLTLQTEAEFKKRMSVYEISETVFVLQGNWIQSERPAVMVKTKKTKIHVKDFYVGGKRLSHTKAKAMLGPDLAAVESRVKELVEHWKDHPLTIDGIQYVSASRVFNDECLDRGGRLYGGWVTLPEAKRLTGTIDGEPVAEIDLRAANLTLLTGMTGNEMPAEIFGDPYNFVNADRNKVKKVVLELLGSGNAHKKRASREFVNEFGTGEFAPVRDQLIDVFPALEQLEPGVLDSNALAYQESEIVIKTIESLSEQGTPSYPMHDALICKATDALEAAGVLRSVFEDHCGIRPALTIQGPEEEQEILGCYTLS